MNHCAAIYILLKMFSEPCKKGSETEDENIHVIYVFHEQSTHEVGGEFRIRGTKSRGPDAKTLLGAERQSRDMCPIAWPRSHF